MGKLLAWLKIQARVAGITGSILYESWEHKSDFPSSSPVSSQWLYRKGSERFAEGGFGSSTGEKKCGTCRGREGPHELPQHRMGER